MTLNATGIITSPAKVVHVSLAKLYPLRENLFFPIALKDKDGGEKTKAVKMYPIKIVEIYCCPLKTH